MAVCVINLITKAVLWIPRGLPGTGLYVQLQMFNGSVLHSFGSHKPMRL